MTPQQLRVFVAVADFEHRAAHGRFGDASWGGSEEMFVSHHRTALRATTGVAASVELQRPARKYGV